LNMYPTPVRAFAGMFAIFESAKAIGVTPGCW
jgi:hypothetical protein